MKHPFVGLIVTTMLVAGMAAGLVQARGQDAMADRAAVEKMLMANETKINEAFVKKDVAGMKMYIADDAMAADQTGIMPVADMLKQLPSMDITITEQALSNPKAVWVDADTVVMTYTWTGKGTYMGHPVPSPMYASTVWSRRAGKWLAVFHQETAAQPMGNMN